MAVIFKTYEAELLLQKLSFWVKSKSIELHRLKFFIGSIV